MQQELFETDIGELPLLFGMMNVGRRLLNCKLRDNGERHPQHTNLTESEGRSQFTAEKRHAFRLLRSCSRVRNSTSDSCDVTVKTGADLAKTKKSQVTFAAFNSTKITSV
jgi:hypothetical protein